MEAARSVEAGFFSLDDERNWPFSGRSPDVHQGLVLLGVLGSFGSAASHLETLLKVQVSQRRLRRLSKEAGAALLPWQDQHAHLATTTGRGRTSGHGHRWGFDSGGAKRVGRSPNDDERRSGSDEGCQPHCEKLRYFARLADAETFGELASFERRRRKVDQVRAVAAVNDGAE